MSASVHIDELSPETRARVLKQISGSDGFVVVTNSDEPQLLPASMADEPLAEMVISGCKKFRTLIPYVIELRARFARQIRGNANIAGCKTWTEFCEKHLDRTTSAVQRAIAVHAKPASVEPEPSILPASTSPHVATACVCPDCGQSLPSRNQLKKHGKNTHNISNADIADFLQRAKSSDATLSATDGAPNLEPTEPETHRQEVHKQVANGGNFRKLAAAAIEPEAHESSLDDAFKASSLPFGEGDRCLQNILPKALNWVLQNQPLTPEHTETLSALFTALGQLSNLTSEYHTKFAAILKREEVAA